MGLFFIRILAVILVLRDGGAEVVSSGIFIVIVISFLEEIIKIRKAIEDKI